MLVWEAPWRGEAAVTSSEGSELTRVFRTARWIGRRRRRTGAGAGAGAGSVLSCLKTEASGEGQGALLLVLLDR